MVKHSKNLDIYAEPAEEGWFRIWCGNCGAESPALKNDTAPDVIAALIESHAEWERGRHGG